jgi:hypothetical protein
MDTRLTSLSILIQETPKVTTFQFVIYSCIIPLFSLSLFVFRRTYVAPSGIRLAHGWNQQMKTKLWMQLQRYFTERLVHSLVSDTSYGKAHT